MSDPTETLESAEHDLQQAMLRGDAEALEHLLAEDAVYVGPDGSPVPRVDDLAAHRSGVLRLTAVDEVSLDALAHGDTGVTRVVLALAGAADGQEFAVRYRYTRAWHRFDDGWKVLSAHASATA